MGDVKQGVKQESAQDLSDKSEVSRALVEYFERSGKRPVVVASHPRSGTHLLLDALRLNFRECRSWKFWGEKNEYLYLLLVSAVYDRLSVPAALRIARRARRPLFKSHARADLKWDAGEQVSLEFNHSSLPPWLCRNATFLYTYRDGRNVLASWHTYHSHAGSRGRGGGGSPAAPTPFSQFIRHQVRGVSRARLWADHVRAWLDHPAARDVHPVKMEDLLAQPAEVLRDVGQKLGLQAAQGGQGALPSRLRNSWHSKINRLLSIRPQSTAIQPEAEPTDWRRAFSREDRRFFLHETGDLLVRLGYETSDAWAEEGAESEPGDEGPAGAGGAAGVAREGGTGGDSSIVASAVASDVVSATANHSFNPPLRTAAGARRVGA